MNYQYLFLIGFIVFFVIGVYINRDDLKSFIKEFL